MKANVSFAELLAESIVPKHLSSMSNFYLFFYLSYRCEVRLSREMGTFVHSAGRSHVSCVQRFSYGLTEVERPSIISGLCSAPARQGASPCAGHTTSALPLTGIQETARGCVRAPLAVIS